MSSPSTLDLIERIGQLIRFEQREIGIHEELHPIHIQVMQYLNKCNRYSDTPLALTHYLGSTKGTISQSLLVLERKHLLKKLADQKDKRMVHLQLTSKAKKLLKKIDDLVLSKDLMDDYSEEVQATVNNTLKTVLRDLQLRNNNRSFGQCSTCKFFVKEKANKYRCGLTQESLRLEETFKICLEHETN